MKHIILILLLINLISSGFSEVIDDCVCGRNKYNHPVILRIVNGTEVRPHSYPWMAFLKDSWFGICAGSIITDRTILSAGHCTRSIWNPEETNWNVGAHWIQDAFVNPEMSYNYLSFHLHPFYRRTKLFTIYDMSIFILNRKINFGPNINPICLPNPGDDRLYWNQKVIVAGWGRTSEGGPIAHQLMETDVVLKTDEECRNMTDLAAYNNDAMICAHEIYRDACQGDSGGPLFVEKSPNHYMILGVVSFGEGCAGDFPGVYAKVPDAETLSWIESISELAGANECRNPEQL